MKPSMPTMSTNGNCNATANVDAAIPLRRFLDHERARGDDIWLTQPLMDGSVKDFSWGEVGDQCRRFATYLLSLDLPPGSHIALIGKNSAHWIMADIAIWMAGHVSVPIYPTVSAETVAYILEHSDARLLILGKMDGVTDGWHTLRHGIPRNLPQATLPMAPRKDLPAWDDLIRTHPPLQEVRPPDPKALATIIYTSGSTGQPKGVMHSHHSIAAACVGIHSLLGMHAGDRMISYLPLAHAAERAAVEANGMNAGFRIYFNHSLETFAEDLRRARPTVFFSVPRLWTKFYQAVNAKIPERKLRLLLAVPLLGNMVRKKILTQLGLQDARLTLTGSAPLPPHTIAWYRRLGLEMLDGYGMSENFALSHFSRPGEVRIGYVGSPLGGAEARIAPNGEVEVKSPAQMLGYYKLPGKAEEETTADGFYRTGDRGEIDERGRLKITGRVKDLFKTSKGKYVAPVPIEQRISNHPAIEVACVAGTGFAQPVAFAMLSEDALAGAVAAAGKAALANELTGWLAEVNATLEDHEKLDRLLLVREPWTIESGFLTPTLKIRRDVIEERYLPEAEQRAQSPEPVIWL